MMEDLEIIDIHAHILPGMDDGARDWDETRRLLRASQEQGVRHIIATPHFSRRTDIGKLKELRDKAARMALEEGIEVEISVGQELRYFEELPLYLEEGRALTLAGSRYALVEFKPSDGYQIMRRAVHELVRAGFIPVLAHVERYPCLREKGKTEELIQSGACLQINAESLLGGMFDRTAAWCMKEIRENRIHFAASDMHRIDSRPPRLKEALKKCSRKSVSPDTAAIFGGNQRYILENRVL